MAKNTKLVDVKSMPGFVIIQGESGPPQAFPVADLIRPEDIPEMSSSEAIEKIPALTSISNLIAILIKTLIEFQVIQDQFAGQHEDYDLEYIVDELEDLGVAW